MIEIKNLKEEDKGRVVRYKSTLTEIQHQFGKITSWNDTYIFVDYNGMERGTATGPNRLDFADNVELKFNRNRYSWDVIKLDEKPTEVSN